VSIEATHDLTVRELLEEFNKRNDSHHWGFPRFRQNERVMLDLEGDEYADGHCSFDCGHSHFHDEYVEMIGGEVETDDCVRIDYEGGSCGFPPDHKIKEIRSILE
jgi:hypothetical protein